MFDLTFKEKLKPHFQNQRICFHIIFLMWKIQVFYILLGVKNGQIILSLISRCEIEFQMVWNRKEEVKFAKKYLVNSRETRLLLGTGKQQWQWQSLMILLTSPKSWTKTTKRWIAKHWLHSRFVQCFTKGQGQNSHFLQCFKIQRKVTSLLLFLDCVSLKFFTQPIAPECNSLVTDLKNLISGLVWIPLEYQDVLHKTSQVLPN